MPGLFYDPQVHNQGGALAKGIIAGTELGMQAFKLNKELQLADTQMEKSKLEQAGMKIELAKKEAMQKAETEIAGLSTKFQDEVNKLSEAIPQRETAPVKPNIPQLGITPDAGIWEKEAAMKSIDPELARKMGVSNVEDYNATREKTGLEYERNKGIYDAGEKKIKDAHDTISSKSHKLLNDIHMTYLKHGLPDKAQEVEDHLMSTVTKLHSIDIDSAEKAWNGTFLADKYGSISSNKRPSWEVKVNKDGTAAVAYNKTGKTLQVQWLQNGEQVKTLAEGQELWTMGKDGIPRVIHKNEKAEKTTIVPEGGVVYEDGKAVFKNPKTKAPGGEGDGEGKKTVMQKNLKSLMDDYGLTKEQALRAVTKAGGKSKIQTQQEAYNASIKNGGTEEEAMAAGTNAGNAYDKFVMGNEKPAGEQPGTGPRKDLTAGGAKKAPAATGNTYTDPATGQTYVKRKKADASQPASTAKKQATEPQKTSGSFKTTGIIPGYSPRVWAMMSEDQRQEAREKQKSKSMGR